SERPDPELHRLFRFLRLVDVLPAELTDHALHDAIAAPRPERIERTVVRWFEGMIGGTDHGAERGVLIRTFWPPAVARMLLAPVEERMPDAPAAVLAAEDRLAEIEDAVRVVAVILEQRDKRLDVAAQRCGGRGPYDLVVRACRDDDRAFMPRKVREVALLVVHGAVVEIGPLAKNLDAQSREIRQCALQCLSGQGLDDEAHGSGLLDTCTIQSVRL